MEKIFFHGTGDGNYSFDNMVKIIESGGIKSLKKQNKNEKGLVNGQNYISVCSWDDEINHEINAGESSFNGWIFGCPCFIISDDINPIKCENYHKNYDSEKERVSQYKDEWHVKDFIPLDKIIGIALPLKDISFIEDNKKSIDKIIKYAEIYNWYIYESDESLIENTKKLLKNNIR